MKIVISGEYGAGWSTWNCPELAFDPRIVEAVEKGEFDEMSDSALEALLASWGFEDVYVGGRDGLYVVEIPKGTIFRITEYDGSEGIEYLDLDDWLTA